MNHAEVQELLGAYALDAVDEGEAVAVEGHLASCPRCRDEVRDHRETAALLAYAGAPAPAGSWDRLAAALEEAPAPAASPRLGRAVARGPRRERGRRAGLAAVAACAALVLGAGVGGYTSLRSDLDERQTEQVLDKLVAREAARAATEAGARTVHLTPPSAEQPVADAVVLPDGTGYLVSKGMRGLTPDRTYQLWAVTGGEKVSVAVLGPAVEVASFRVDARSLDALAITEERAGGVAASANQAVAYGLVERSTAVTPTP